MGRCEYCHAVNKKGSGRTFHRFPRSDLYQLEKWVENFGRPNWRPRSDSLLCSAHFEESCFDRTGFLVRLQKDSVPTLFGEIAHLCVSCKCAKFSSRDRTFHKQVLPAGLFQAEVYIVNATKFPLKDPELLEQWVENINIEALDIEQSLICSTHFEKSCFRKVKGYSILKKGSIPTLFGSNSRITCSKRRGKGKLCKHNESNRDSNDKNSKETFTSMIRNRSLLPVLIEPNENVAVRIITGGSQVNGEKAKDLFCTSSLRVNNSQDFMKNDCENGGVRVRENSPPLATLSARERKRLLTHDHQYYDSPETLRRKLQKVRKALCEKQRIARVQNQHMKRMQKQILTLEEMISEFKKKPL